MDLTTSSIKIITQNHYNMKTRSTIQQLILNLPIKLQTASVCSISKMSQFWKELARSKMITKFLSNRILIQLKNRLITQFWANSIILLRWMWMKLTNKTIALKLILIWQILQSTMCQIKLILYTMWAWKKFRAKSSKNLNISLVIRLLMLLFIRKKLNKNKDIMSTSEMPLLIQQENYLRVTIRKSRLLFKITNLRILFTSTCKPWWA